MDFTAISGWTLGAVLLFAGLWVLRDRGQDDGTCRAKHLSKASQAVIGLSLMIAGYHAAAYVSPDGWFRLRVPIERAWIMGVGIVVAVGLSLCMDWKDRARTEAQGPADSGSRWPGR